MSVEALSAGTPFVASAAAFIVSGGSFIGALFFSAEGAGSERAAVFIVIVGGVAGAAPEGSVFESGHRRDRVAMTVVK